MREWPVLRTPLHRLKTEINYIQNSRTTTYPHRTMYTRTLLLFFSRTCIHYNSARRPAFPLVISSFHLHLADAISLSLLLSLFSSHARAHASMGTRGKEWAAARLTINTLSLVPAVTLRPDRIYYCDVSGAL